jgi:signal transduction histidine kinase
MPTILLVDDLSENRYLLETVLASAGYATLSACNGAEALARAADREPDLVLSDILMPVMDGFDLCRVWKQDPHLARIPFAFYTATYTDPKDEAFALGLGAERFLIKPMPMEDLLREVATLLGGRAATGTPPPEPDGEAGFLREHSQALFRKLEKKQTDVVRLEAAVVQVQKMESLGRMAARVAHDLNNLLSPILSLTEVLQTRCQDRPDLQSSLATILAAAERGRLLVRDLTEFAPAGEPRFQPVDMNAQIRQAVDLLKADAPAPIEWLLDLAEPLAPIDGDPVALGRAMMNLGRNALDALGGMGSLEFGTRNDPAGGVEAWVADTGHGIPAGILAQVTEPFVTTKGPGKGTGLGLAIVASVVQVHGGTLTIESEERRGTIVRIRLPEHR